MYVLQLAGENKVCPEGTYVAIIGTTVENFANPEADIEAGLKLLPAGAIIEKFISVSDIYEPLDDGVASKCFVSKSYDSATHFESAAENILEMFHRIHGKPYNFDTSKKGDEEETVG
jgi:Rab GDP dissociation inhibitor